MTNRINPNPNYYSLAAKKRQQEVEERMALLNKIKEDADKHNMSYGKYKENIMEYYKNNNAYPTDISQLNKENLVNINGNMYIYNKDTDNLIKYVPIINEQGKLIKFVIKRYDINGNFVDDFYESEVFNL